ncbi:MAG TPA: type I-E CRISPR-associated protein Cse2/CasB [Candidatus Cloacimonadota bacterium]|mgnify:FL=1|nr:type I-E CRISPR-associated protein Cse2/CasB [Candidatus Cloacimonadota bacterium]HQH50734.1 type I-E CRISPR-associated protein Cse2/CasB [Candidatus Cloacimonadota bacterium]
MNRGTVDFITSLENLKEGDLGILRKLRGARLDEELPGFDLFTALWWPLRQKNQRAPKREVAWLIAKLFAEFRFEQREEATLPILMGSICRKLGPKKELPRVLARFDQLASLDIMHMEEPLLVIMGILRKHQQVYFDWVDLTDVLSFWEQETVKREWSDSFTKAYKINKEDSDVD